MEFSAFLEVGDGLLSRLPIPLTAGDLPALMVDAVPAGFGVVANAVQPSVLARPHSSAMSEKRP
jgi:hypothetical protein